MSADQTSRDDTQHVFATDEWFQMVGEEMAKGAARNITDPDYQLTFMERYSGGAPRADGSLPGFFVEVHGATARTRTGVAPGESADVVIELELDVSEALSLTLTDDPAFQDIVHTATQRGAFVSHGDRSRLTFLGGVHDAIVRRTLPR